jgi:hypothetical protein
MNWDAVHYRKFEQIAQHTKHGPALITEKDREFFLVVAADVNHCDFCPDVMGKGIHYWISHAHTICVSCGTRLQTKVSFGHSHRCIECSLVRCASPDSRCEECAANMAA